MFTLPQQLIPTVVFEVALNLVNDLNIENVSVKCLVALQLHIHVCARVCVCVYIYIYIYIYIMWLHNIVIYVKLYAAKLLQLLLYIA